LEREYLKETGFGVKSGRYYYLGEVEKKIKT
jgi:hypothetical protein